jgi:hypothetical protein
MRLEFADNVDKVYQLEHFPVLSSGTCLISVPHLKLNYQPLTLFPNWACDQLWRSYIIDYYCVLLITIDYYSLFMQRN